MRAPNDMPRVRRGAPGRGRVFLIIAAILLFLLFTSLRQIAEFWTEYLWFDSVQFSKVWSRTLFIKIELGALFTGVFFLVLWLNLLIADRISPKFRPLGPDEELLHRYHQIVDRRAGTLRVLIAAIFALITGAQMSSQWQEWVLFNNGGDFGVADPQFQMDVGFYVFRLPFLVAVVDWLFASLVIVLLISAVAHYLNGGIRLQSPFERVTPQVKAHLSVLLAVLALAKAADYYLQRFQIMFSERGVVNGASYTEVNAQLPALSLLLFIALMSFVLFILNIRRRGWVLPIVAVGLWAFVQLVVGTSYPAIFQRTVVAPEESAKESQAIENNIRATRAAYGLDKITPKEFATSSDVAEATRAVDDHPETIRNVQLLDPKQINETFQRLQSVVSPAAFARVATDRYVMRVPGGPPAPTQVVVSNREVNAATIPIKGWEGQHLTYTHGYGLALAAGNAVTRGGEPDFAVKDIPVADVEDKIDLPVTQPNNYYFNTPGGALSDAAIQYSLVNTTAPEFDYVKKAEDPSKTYGGNGGVPIDSFGRRIAFALKFADPNLLISQYITDQSRILFMRDIRQRAATAAPFLEFDSDPYPVVDNGRTVYVLDAYTTSDNYPNSQRTPKIAGSNDLRNEEFNYVRNSVKAVIDTYDGSVTFYVIDTKDPVIDAWKSAFPELFKEVSTMRQSLREHLRYPEDIFNVQTEMYGRYHINDPSAFYRRDDAWEPPAAPETRIEKINLQQPSSTPAPGATTQATQKSARMQPYYVMNQLPGDARPNFMLMRQYQPFSGDDSKPKLTGFMVARCDGDDLGQLQLYQMADKDAVDGPSIVAQSMLIDSNVSQRISLLNQQGSTVLLSDLIMVPLDRSVLYVRSMSLVTESSQQKFPLVKAVIVSFNQKVVLDDTLRGALKQLFPGSDPQTLEGGRDAPLTSSTTTPDTTGTTVPGTGPPGSTTPGTTPGTTPESIPPLPSGSGDAANLVALAERDLADAQKALDDNNLGEYQRKVNDAQRKIAEAHALQTGTTTTTTPAPTAPPETATTTAAPP